MRAVTEETLEVRAVGSATLAPHTVRQVQVIVPSPRARGKAMIKTGPLGLCQVRGVVEVEKDSSIWLANTGTQPIHIEQNEVVAMAECVLAVPGASPGNDRDDRDKVNGLVERAVPSGTQGGGKATGHRDHPREQQCVEQSDRRGEEEGWNDAVLYQLPMTQSSHEGRCLPAPSHGGQSQHPRR